MYGLLNADSITKAREHFIEFLSSNQNDIAIFCLGEVDCNGLIWRKIKQMSIFAYLNISVERYFNFLKDFPNKFIISSVVFPIVESYQEDPYTLRKKHPRSHVKARRLERSKIVEKLNELLKLAAKETKNKYLDITSPTLNAKGYVRKKFINSLDDVHLNKETIVPVISRKLNEALRNHK